MSLTKDILEALLFVSDRPLSEAQLAQVCPEPVDRAQIRSLLEELALDYEGRAVELKQVAGGWKLVTRPQYGQWIRRLYQLDSRPRLSRAALETLAIIVYRQPITKQEIEAIRGVESSGVLKTLLERRLVRILGRKPVVGRPLLYGSSREFLEYFGLRDLAELPRPEDVEDQDEPGSFERLEDHGNQESRGA